MRCFCAATYRSLYACLCEIMCVCIFENALSMLTLIHYRCGFYPQSASPNWLCMSVHERRATGEEEEEVREAKTQEDCVCVCACLRVCGYSCVCISRPWHKKKSRGIARHNAVLTAVVLSHGSAPRTTVWGRGGGRCNCRKLEQFFSNELQQERQFEYVHTWRSTTATYQLPLSPAPPSSPFPFITAVLHFLEDKTKLKKRQ
jgi:hypothetical protein